MDGGQGLRVGDRATLSRADFPRLFDALRAGGYRIVGPTVRDGAIVHDEIAAVDQLPIGWTDEQDGGRYRLKRRDDQALFGYTVGPLSWKQLFFVPRRRLARIRRRDARSEWVSDAGAESAPPRLALLGARACDLAAVAIQDRVLIGGAFVDPDYAARRDGTFVIAVHCGQAAATCFCVSMGTGPRATSGFDLALTELLDGAHRFHVEIGSAAGAAIAAAAGAAPAPPDDGERAGAVVARTAAGMGRTLDTRGIKELLYDNLEHPRWDHVAERCLACGNCTLACPTCFCSTVEERTNLAGTGSERSRRWDSCFTAEHSHLPDGIVRAATRARYRQWLVHKVASWIDQFGSSGCVGCGRCITWCPVGIDLTEELAAIRKGPRAAAG